RRQRRQPDHDARDRAEHEARRDRRDALHALLDAADHRGDARPDGGPRRSGHGSEHEGRVQPLDPGWTEIRGSGGATGGNHPRRPASRAYLRFTLGSAPAQGFSATLRIYPLTSSKKGLRLRRVTDAGWAERSLTYGSAPAADRAVVRSGRLRAHRWKSINVTR